MADPVTWSRLEPSARDKGLGPGLEARVHDPLWLLGRQWQFGELTADGDLGSAVAVELLAQVAPLSGYRPGAPGADGSVPYDAAGAPLEAVVEAEDVRAAPTARLRVSAGAQFLRILEAGGGGAYAGAYRTHYALAAPEGPQDAATARFLAVVVGRAVDGGRLAGDLRAALHPDGGGDGALPAEPAIADADAAAVRAAAEAWLAWYDGLFAEPGGERTAWVPERMEYTFGVEVASGGVTLEAEELTDGRLDWHAFTAIGSGGGPSSAGAVSSLGPLTMVPSPVSYPGMPAPRLWEFEDARVDFGGVEAAPEDLGRMLLTEFALVFGGDWLLVPLEAPAGSLVTIVALDVRDTFGHRQRVAATSALEGALGGWRMFTLTREGGDADGEPLLVAPVLPSASLHGHDLEEVLLLRDETANLAWAVERRVEGQHGAPVDRAQAEYEARGDEPAPPPAAPGAFRYRLATDVPDHWLPLLPVREHPEDPSIGLRLGSLPRPQPDGTIARPRAHGRLLQVPTGADGLVLREEEVPREGARVARAFQMARWTGGETFLWASRRKTVGRGEGSSGLRYDVMEGA